MNLEKPKVYRKKARKQIYNYSARISPCSAHSWSVHSCLFNIKCDLYFASLTTEMFIIYKKCYLNSVLLN